MGQALGTTAAEGLCSVRGASDISGLSTRTKLVKQCRTLSLLTQLEVCGHKCSVFVFESVAKSLHCVGVDESSGDFTLIVDSTNNITETLGCVKTESVDVAVGFAAALLCGEAVLGESRLCAIEAVFEAVVECVEAITQAVGDTTELSIYVLIVESFK